MLNYNVNYIEPLKRSRNFLLGKVDYMWARTTNVAAGTQPPIVYGSGSISFVPYSPSTLFFSSSLSTGSLSSGSAIGQPIAISVTGSGVWPTTGSNQFSIVIGSSLGFNQSNILTLSAAAGNMNLSGSRISSSFVPVGNDEYNINFGMSHTKGNIYNPLVNWSAEKTSPFGNSVNVNGEGIAEFNLVENTSQSLVSIPEVSGSVKSGSFNYAYSFGVTASFTASINNVTGSTTMSFVCAEEGLNKVVTFFNPTTTTAIASGSFVASNDTIHNFSSSIIYNKGNISNSNINYLITGSEIGYTSLKTTSSFVIVKNANEGLVSTASFKSPIISGSFKNAYAFNITASLSSSWTPVRAFDSQSYIIEKISLSLPEIGFLTSSFTTSSIFTASFEAQTSIDDYNITASMLLYQTIPVEYLVVAGGGAGSNQGPQGNTAYGGGAGGGGVLTGSIALRPYESQVISVGAGGVQNLIAGQGGNGKNSYISGSDVYIASTGGGAGGYQSGGGSIASGVNGGNGGAPGGAGIPGQGNNAYSTTQGGGSGTNGLDGFVWVDGVYYGAGGGGWLQSTLTPFTTTPSGFGTIGKGGDGVPAAGGQAANGNTGSIILRYEADAPMATGGTITSSSGYIYHTFTTTSSLFTINNPISIPYIGSI